MEKDKNAKRGRIWVVILILLFIAAVYLVWEMSEIWMFAGEYEVVTEADSTYVLKLSRIGRIDVVDVGAGNPAMQGFVYRTPFSAKDGHYVLKAGGETDPVYLDLKGSRMKANVWLAMIGKESPEGFEPCKVIILETKTDRMQFNEN